MTGWAARRNGSSERLSIHAALDGVVIASSEADLLRADLKTAGIGDGRHGFRLKLDPLPLVSRVGDLTFVATSMMPEGAVGRRLDEIGPHGQSKLLVANPDVYKSVASVFPLQAGRERAQSKFSRPPDALLCLLDIQDLVHYLETNVRVTGIQRVVCGLVDQALRTKSLTGVEFCVLDRTAGSIKIFDGVRLQDIVSHALDGVISQAAMKAKVSGLDEDARSYMPGAGDIYIIAGAYWVIPDFGAHLLTMKRNGALIGTYIYDLIPITHPKWVTDDTRLAVIERGFDILTISDFFLTISDYVRAEVAQLLLMEFRVDKPVTAVKLPHQLPASSAQAAVTASSGVAAAPFVLCVCTLEGRKNHVLLFHVWSSLIRRYGAVNVPDLVLVGKWGWNIDSFRHLCQITNNLNGKIIIKNHVGDQELTELYKTCMFTVFPSFVEGWGLPVGESLTLGKLCVASDKTSIPEVGESFADYFDPEDIFSCMSAVERCLSDKEHLRSRTQNIVDHFEPRSWLTFYNDFIASSRASAKMLETRRGMDPALLRLQNGKIQEINGENLSKFDVPWGERRLKLVRVSGWSHFEHWGCWACAPRARLRFSLEPGSARTHILFLQLRLARNETSSLSLKLVGGEQIEAVPVTHQPRWCWIEFSRPADDWVEVEIAADARLLVDDNGRIIFFGISRIAVFASDTENERLAAFRTVVAPPLDPSSIGTGAPSCDALP